MCKNIYTDVKSAERVSVTCNQMDKQSYRLISTTTCHSIGHSWRLVSHVLTAFVWVWKIVVDEALLYCVDMCSPTCFRHSRLKDSRDSQYFHLIYCYILYSEHILIVICSFLVTNLIKYGIVSCVS